MVAADLFGECAPELLTVADAWRAIGVGYNYSDTTLFITNIQSLLKLIYIESVIISNHLILGHPLLLLPSIFPSITMFSN